MLDDIRLEIASRVFLVKVRVEGEAAPARQMRSVTGSAQHSAMGTFNSNGRAEHGSGAMARASAPEAAQVVRSMPKVGRNDPCPCGSGKKYKFCHGA